MSARAASRSESCGEEEARARLRDARAQLQLAELTDGAASEEEMKAAISCAVLAGIAAADAACCRALGRRNRSQNHNDAVQIVASIAPGGSDASKKLQRLLAMKDESQYGFHGVGGQKLEHAKQRARSLVAFAEKTLQR